METEPFEDTSTGDLMCAQLGQGRAACLRNDRYTIAW